MVVEVAIAVEVEEGELEGFGLAGGFGWGLVVVVWFLFFSLLEGGEREEGGVAGYCSNLGEQ